MFVLLVIYFKKVYLNFHFFNDYLSKKGKNVSKKNLKKLKFLLFSTKKN